MSKKLSRRISEGSVVCVNARGVYLIAKVMYISHDSGNCYCSFGKGKLLALVDLKDVHVIENYDQFESGVIV